MLAHKLWSSLGLVLWYISVISRLLFSFDVNVNFDGGIGSQAIKAELKLHLRALLATGCGVYGGQRQRACSPGVITDYSG